MMQCQYLCAQFMHVNEIQCILCIVNLVKYLKLNNVIGFQYKSVRVHDVDEISATRI